MRKRVLFLTGALLMMLAINPTMAQKEPVDRVAVTFSDPSRPGLLKANLISGSITVKGYEGKEVIIEARARSHRYSRKEDREGMQKIAITSTGLSVEEQYNEMSVTAASHRRTIDLNIQVPVNTSLKLGTVNNGQIQIENIEGEFELNNTNGSIEAYDVSGSVVANTTNGKVHVTFKKIAPDKPMSFVTFNGKVDVTFPANIKADVKMKSEQGDIYSDFDIKLKDTPRLIREDSRERGGKYKVRIESAIYGSINGGGPEYYFSTYNGSIYIRNSSSQ